MEKYVQLNTRGSSGQSVQGSTEQKAEPTAHPLSLHSSFSTSSPPSLCPTAPCTSAWPSPSRCAAAPSNFQRKKLVMHPGDVSELPQMDGTALHRGNPLHGAGHAANQR